MAYYNLRAHNEEGRAFYKLFLLLMSLINQIGRPFGKTDDESQAIREEIRKYFKQG